MDESATREALKAEASKPLVPGRMRVPMFDVVDDFMPLEWAGELGKWLYSQRTNMVRYGDEEGHYRYSYELDGVDNLNPKRLTKFKKALVDQFPKSLTKIEVPDFDLQHIDISGSCYHQGHHYNWHDGLSDYADQIVPSRRIAYCYFMHSDPKMFSGGDLEWVNGSMVEPKNNRLVLYHPVQQHRITSVECWSSQIMHARWSISGWVHGDAPEGWTDRLALLRDEPPQV